MFRKKLTNRKADEGNSVAGKDTNLDLIPSASVSDALIRQKGNMLLSNVWSDLKTPVLLHFSRLDIDHSSFVKVSV